jgi:geranylgeranylglycerol-phosphate geranylgeranyltransferase
MNRAVAVLRLTRIEHSIMLVIAVVAAELLAGGLPAPGVLALSLITPIFVSMGSFAINDYFDIEVDRLNKKKGRPLVSGALTPAQALWVAGASFAIGVGASAFSVSAFAIALVFALLAITYASKLKEMLLVGNAYIALSMAIPFIYGSYVEGGALAPAILPVCAMVFLSGLAREIHGTIRDYSGDVKVRNARTLPKAAGIGAAAAAALVLYVVAIATSAYLFVYVAPFRANLAYGVPVLVSDALLLYVGIGHVLYRTRRFYLSARDVSLAAMALAILAILIAPLIRI